MQIESPVIGRNETVPAPKKGESGFSGTIPWFAFAFCIIFFLQGLILIPYLGLEIDESLFGTGVFWPSLATHRIRIFGNSIPIMIMEYIGSLKTWIYAPILLICHSSVYSVRVPAVIMGAVTIWLFFLMLRRCCGARVALAGCALLSFDSVFIMATAFDWGPVVLQHLTLMGSMFLITRFYESGRVLDLGAGFIFLGLGLWDKALFIWALIGLAVAVLAVFPREFFTRLNRRTALVAIAGFLAGSAPLLYYNVRTGMRTFRRKVEYSTAGIEGKLKVAQSTLDGSTLFGFMVREEPAPQPIQASSFLEKESVRISHRTGEPRTSLTPIAFIAALVLLPFLWSSPVRRPIVFSLIVILIAWVQMVLNRGTGGSAHHVVLLWPFPHLIIAAVFSQTTLVLRRFSTVALIILIALICGSNLLVTNQYLAQAIQRGSSTTWTDAVYPLADYLKQLPAKRIYVMDWGMFDSLCVLNEGSIPLSAGALPFMNEPMTDADRLTANEMLADPEAIFLSHTQGNEAFPRPIAQMNAMAKATGYRKQILKIISDKMGRPIFEIYRWTGTGNANL